jgi:hypothetical protein
MIINHYDMFEISRRIHRILFESVEIRPHTFVIYSENKAHRPTKLSMLRFIRKKIPP